jgi:hypothetical protein
MAGQVTLILRSALFARVSKNEARIEASWFETGKRLLTMRNWDFRNEP